MGNCCSEVTVRAGMLRRVSQDTFHQFSLFSHLLAFLEPVLWDTFSAPSFNPLNYKLCSPARLRAAAEQNSAVQGAEETPLLDFVKSLCSIRHFTPVDLIVFYS